MADVTLPHTITPGAIENVSHVQENDQALADIINGAMPAYSTWKPIFRVTTTSVTSLTTTPFLVSPAVGSTGLVSSPAVGSYGFVLDPADFTAGTRTSQYRVRLAVYPNAVAPAVNFVAQLNKIDSFTATSGNEPVITAITAVGNTATVSTPSADTFASAVSTAFTATALNPHVLTIKTASGTMAAGSRCAVQIELMYRQT